MSPEERFIEIAASYINCPYIWGGKGDLIFNDKELVLQKNPFGPSNPLVFDCSGLVTWALKELTKELKLDLPVMTGSHSAKTMLEQFPKASDSKTPGTLNIYLGHVSIQVFGDWVIEACRGDSTTRTPQQAKSIGARVMFRMNRRNPKSLLGHVRIPLDRSQMRL